MQQQFFLLSMTLLLPYSYVEVARKPPILFQARKTIFLLSLYSSSYVHTMTTYLRLSWVAPVEVERLPKSHGFLVQKSNQLLHRSHIHCFRPYFPNQLLQFCRRSTTSIHHLAKSDNIEHHRARGRKRSQFASWLMYIRVYIQTLLASIRYALVSYPWISGCSGFKKYRWPTYAYPPLILVSTKSNIVGSLIKWICAPVVSSIQLKKHYNVWHCCILIHWRGKNRFLPVG